MSDQRKYFGTDGIRGRANSFPMTADMALKVAMAAALALDEKMQSRTLPGAPAWPQQKRVVIGKDTRLSGYMLEQAMGSGFTAMGMDVVLVGPIPTPAIAMLTRTLRCDIGVMISASHNLYQDNGIKLFGADGYKLSDDLERAIEAKLAGDMNASLPTPDHIGKASRLGDAPGRYIEYIKRSVPRGQSFEGLRVVVDCANGAAYRIAPQVLWELEAEVIPLGVNPNGRNINDGCGATDTGLLQQTVVDRKADLGIALDGDADRLIMVDEKGTRIDGDQLMALLAMTKKSQGWLQGEGVVATVMSNLGLERYLAKQKLNLVRTPVGDRYVVERMRSGGYNLGGEQSGHIILGDFATTGDGLLAALQVLSALRDTGKPASEALHLFDPLPQILKNVKISNGNKPLTDKKVQAAIEKAEGKLSKCGRVLVRPSGTEPLIRVMGEGDDQALVREVVDDLCAAIEKAAG